jgi:uncharacterized membrane protein
MLKEEHISTVVAPRGVAHVLANHSERSEPLDFFRGLAILMVIAGHFLPDRVVFGGMANAVSTLGRGGVIVFFLLSGYLIFKNLQTQKIPFFLPAVFQDISGLLAECAGFGRSWEVCRRV